MEVVDGKTYLFKKVNHSTYGTEKGIKCFFLKQDLHANYWIIFDDNDEMKPVFASFEAVEQLGTKICAERINDLFEEFSKDQARLMRSHFWK